LSQSTDRNQDIDNQDEHHAQDQLGTQARTARAPLPFRQSRAWTGHVLTYAAARRAMFTLEVFFWWGNRNKLD
jgi:hypothetical protein